MKPPVRAILCLLALFPLSLTAQPPASSVEGKEAPKLQLNEDLIKAWYAQPKKLDITEPDDVFTHVFSGLPKEVTILPGENYYYWKLIVNGRNIWGNIRLPAGRRERGVLSFGYAEFNPFPSRSGQRFSRAKYFTKADGLLMKEIDDHTYDVTFGEKTVRFHLNRISQHQPKKFKVKAHEKSLCRTFDESGMQFYLMFNTEKNYFFWVLDEEVTVPDHFTKLGNNIFLAKRTGFIFWADPKAENRKVLATIRKISVLRNDYNDGPFDQLSDNYADEIEIKKYMELAIPSIKGRIDKYGYYTNRERPSRVALSNYGTYYTFGEAVKFIQAANKTPDPYHYLSRGGVPPRGLNWDGTKREPTPKPAPSSPSPPK